MDNEFKIDEFTYNHFKLIAKNIIFAIMHIHITKHGETIGINYWNKIKEQLEFRLSNLYKSCILLGLNVPINMDIDSDFIGNLVNNIMIEISKEFKNVAQGKKDTP